MRCCVGVLLVALPDLLAALPASALAAVVIAAGLSLADVGSMVRLWRIGSSEFWLALATFLGVALIGVIEGVFLAVGLSLVKFIQRAWWPHDAVLGRADGVKGYHDLEFYPDARQVPGLLLYRFDAPLFFANAEVFRDRLRERIAEAGQPVRWVVIAAEPITDVDTTAAAVLDELKEELDGRGITLAFAELKDPIKAKLRRYGALDGVPEESMFPTDRDRGQRVREGDRPGVDGLGGGRANAPRATCGDDRRQDRVEVADHRVGRARHHRRVAVGVDRQDRLGRAGADHVLDRPADAAGDVQVGRDPGPGLTDLLGMRAPAGRGHDARDADGAAEQRGELVELREALGAPDAAAATDDDTGVRERDRARLGGDVRGDPDAEVAIGQVGRERLDGDRRRRLRRGRRLRRRAARPSGGGSGRRAEPPRAGCRPSADG